MIEIKRTKHNEIETLLVIQKDAFKEDLKRYQDFESSPATESYERLERKVNLFHHYTIYIENQVAGGLDIRDLGEHIRLNRIFLHSDYHNQGYGKEIMKIIEEMYPHIKKWSLDTPKDHIKNRYFYESLGYVFIGEHQINDRLTLVDYVKEK